MNCFKCGFIYNGPETKCPYCGVKEVGAKQTDERRVMCFGKITFSYLQLDKFVLLNIVAICEIVNIAATPLLMWYPYVCLTASVGFVIINLVSRSKKPMSLYWLMDFLFVVNALIWELGAGQGRVVVTFVVPSYVAAITVAETVTYIFNKKESLTKYLPFKIWHTVEAVAALIIAKTVFVRSPLSPVESTMLMLGVSVTAYVLLNSIIVIVFWVSNRFEEWMR